MYREFGPFVSRWFLFMEGAGSPERSFILSDCMLRTSVRARVKVCLVGCWSPLKYTVFIGCSNGNRHMRSPTRLSTVNSIVFWNRTNSLPNNIIGLNPREWNRTYVFGVEGYSMEFPIGRFYGRGYHTRTSWDICSSGRDASYYHLGSDSAVQSISNFATTLVGSSSLE